MQIHMYSLTPRQLFEPSPEQAKASRCDGAMRAACCGTFPACKTSPRA
jgi:hypothetical protein